MRVHEACKRSLVTLSRTLLILCVGLLVSPVASSAEAMPARDLVRVFDLAVFGKGGGERETVTKWDDRIQVAFLGIRDEELRDAHRKFFKAMSDKSAMDISVVTYGREKSNYFVFFLPEDNYLDHRARYLEPKSGNKSPCYLSVKAAEEGRIDKATVLVNTHAPMVDIARCVETRLVQSFGVLHRVGSGVTKVSSGPRVKPKLRFSEQDWRVLHLLYRKEIEPGMTRQETLKIVKRLLREMEKTK